MSNAPGAALAGNEYQALLFWRHATQMFAPDSNISHVGFEDGIKSFDDVVVHYARPIYGIGGQTERECYQAKFNMAIADDLTAQLLTDPALIHAEKNSLLVHLRNAVRQAEQEGCLATFVLFSPRSVAKDDPLRELYHSDTASLRVDRLFQKGPASRLGKVREAWKANMDVDDAELRRCLERFRIIFGATSTPQFRTEVNTELRLAGFAPIGNDSPVNPYNALIWDLYRQGVKRFDKETLRKHAGNLWTGTPQLPSDAVVIGIRSYTRHTESMPQQTRAFLPLEANFDERHLLAGRSWEDDIRQPIAKFLRENLNDGDHCHLQIPAHYSIAFAAGRELEVKSGFRVDVQQRGVHGIHTWNAADPVPAGAPIVTTNEEKVGDGDELAVVFELTRAARADVEAYVRSNLPAVGRLLIIGLEGGPAQNAVKGGGHAAAVVATAVNGLARARRAGATTHLFFSAPNAIAFLLGQQCRGLGVLQVHEHDFEQGGAAYFPGIKIGQKVTA